MDALVSQDDLVRIQMEFMEMPGLRLTPVQIRRLCGLSGDICDHALSMLAERGFLKRTVDGYFRRPTAQSTRTRPVIA